MNIGTKLKNLRTLNGLTQGELADRCELTKGYISQLENDLTEPSISTLQDILKALGSSLKDFFSEEDEVQVVFKKEDYVSNDNTTHKLTWLVNNAQKNAMEPIIVELQPGCSLTPDMPHEGQEFGYVLKGKVVIVLANKAYKANSGETFYYDTNKVHYLKNVSNEVTKILWISCPPNF